mmetsp:Transcript_2361/g.5299  ORF Transcript_2361/g.5299 Transcript_2361/m.5299 type:complete len:80 (-) Transcript_2361:192-431(-)
MQCSQRIPRLHQNVSAKPLPPEKRKKKKALPKSASKPLAFYAQSTFECANRSGWVSSARGQVLVALIKLPLSHLGTREK